MKRIGPIMDGTVLTAEDVPRHRRRSTCTWSPIKCPW